MPLYNIAGVTVDFPFEAYREQLVYMEKVILALEAGDNALLESPTGTGKTLCLLCATLAWQREVKQSEQAARARSSAQARNSAAPGGGGGGVPLAPRRIPRVIYSSRTHSQLRQVVHELRRTVYRPKVCFLGSREQMCVHHEVSKLSGNGQSAACQALTASQQCRFHLKFQDAKRKAGGLLPHPDEHVDEAIRDVPDIEDFVALNKAHDVCPFFLARELQRTADILFLPYNYLIDPHTRQTLNIDLAQDILIFDEAHNIERVCTDAASFSLTSIEIAGAVRELDRVISGSHNQAAADEVDPDEAGGSRAAGMWLRLRQLVLQIDKAVHAIPLAPREGGERMHVGSGEGLRTLLGDVGITAETVTPFKEACMKAVLTLGGLARFGVSAPSHFNLQKLADVLVAAYDESRPASLYKLCVQEVAERDSRAAPLHEGPRARSLGYWCFDAGVAMREIAAAGVHSILLTSGTLSPLASFACELGVPFVQQLENPHVIDPSQCRVGVFSAGPSGHELTSSYRSRHSDAPKAELGHALVNFARVVPQGILVFFPSYAALRAAHDAWAGGGEGGVLARLRRHKHVVVEPRDAASLAAAVEEYMGCVRTRGAVLLAVCRGKLSEGIDFSDAACRAVVITGLPLPPVFDAQVRLKRAFLDERRRHDGAALSGEAWYHQQAMRAINQAVGRVIRHARDFGAVMLCDSRFSRREWVDGLSLWLRHDVRHFGSFGQGLLSVQQFFKAHRDLPAAGADSPAPQSAPAPASPRPPQQPRPSLPAAPPAAPPPSLLFALGGAPKVLPLVCAYEEDAPSPREDDGLAHGGACGGGACGGRTCGGGVCEEGACGRRVDGGGMGGGVGGGGAIGGGVGGGGVGGGGVARVALLHAGGAPKPPAASARPRAVWTPREVPQVAADAPADCVSRASTAVAQTEAEPEAGAGDAPPKPKSKEEIASTLLKKAKATLNESEYAAFMALVRDLKGISPADVNEALMRKPRHSAAALFGSEARRDLARLFLAFVPSHHRPFLKQTLSSQQSSKSDRPPAAAAEQRAATAGVGASADAAPPRTTSVAGSCARATPTHIAPACSTPAGSTPREGVATAPADRPLRETQCSSSRPSEAVSRGAKPAKPPGVESGGGGLEARTPLNASCVPGGGEGAPTRGGGSVNTAAPPQPGVQPKDESGKHRPSGGAQSSGHDFISLARERFEDDTAFKQFKATLKALIKQLKQASQCEGEARTTLTSCVLRAIFQIFTASGLDSLAPTFTRFIEEYAVEWTQIMQEAAASKISSPSPATLYPAPPVAPCASARAETEKTGAASATRVLPTSFGAVGADRVEYDIVSGCPLKSKKQKSMHEQDI